MTDWATYTMQWDLFERNITISFKRQVYNSCLLSCSYGVYGDPDAHQRSTERTVTGQTCCTTEQNGKTYDQHHMLGQNDQHLLAERGQQS